MARHKDYPQYTYLGYSQEELENYYWCLVRFWASVCWHYGTIRNKSALGNNIHLLHQTYKRRTKQ